MTHDEATSEAKAYFEALGYEVRRGKTANTQGPDLTLIGPVDVFRVEVLTTHKTKRGSWRSCAVQADRRRDDFVFLSFAAERFVVIDMETFLAKAADGVLAVTALARLFCGGVSQKIRIAKA